MNFFDWKLLKALFNKTESQNIGRLWQPIAGQPVAYTKIWLCPIKLQCFRRPWHTLAQNSIQSKICYDFSKVFQIFGQNSRILKFFQKKIGGIFKKPSRHTNDATMTFCWANYMVSRTENRFAILRGLKISEKGVPPLSTPMRDWGRIFFCHKWWLGWPFKMSHSLSWSNDTHVSRLGLWQKKGLLSNMVLPPFGIIGRVYL